MAIYFKSSHHFQTIILGIQPLVFGGCSCFSRWEGTLWELSFHLWEWFGKRSGVNAGLFLKQLTWVDCWLLFLGNYGDIADFHDLKIVLLYLERIGETSFNHFWFSGGIWLPGKQVTSWESLGNKRALPFLLKKAYLQLLRNIHPSPRTTTLKIIGQGNFEVYPNSGSPASLRLSLGKLLLFFILGRFSSCLFGRLQRHTWQATKSAESRGV